MVVRKLIVRSAIAAMSVLLAAIAAPAQEKSSSDFTVTLLGTASPAPRPKRMGPSTLVEVNGQRLLIDAGRGAVIRLWQLKVPIGSLDATFLTHFHSDHTSGLPDVWLTGWIGAPYGGRHEPFKLIGPTGTKTLMESLERGYRADIDIRLKDEGEPEEGIKTDVTEFSGSGVVYEQDGVKVTAFENDHGDLIKPSYGYRIDYDGRSVVLSGDTRYSQKVIDAAMGADLLIHEVCVAADALLEIPFFKRVMDHHTSPEEAGQVFTAVKPKLAVYSHVGILSNKDNPEPTLEEIIARTHSTYDGEVVMGEDLMRFEIGKDGVKAVD